MRGWLFAFGCLVALIGLTQVNADEPTDVTMDLRVNRGTFVSTDETLGVLHIVNRSRSSIYLGPATYVITHQSGGVIDTGSEVWREAPHRMIVVADGSTFDKTLSLPRCAPPQAQCSFDVQVKLPIEYERTSAQAAAQTPVRERTLQSAIAHVAVRADPTATFDMKGLRDNRPILIIQANARSREMPNVLKLGFFPRLPHNAQAEMDPLQTDLSAALRGYGIAPRGYEMAQEDGQPIVRIYIDAATPRDQLKTVMAKLNEQFHDRFNPGQMLYGLNLMRSDALYASFTDRVNSALHRLCVLESLDDPQYARGYYDRARIRSEWNSSGLPQQEPDISFSAYSPTPVPISYESSRAFITATPRHFNAAKRNGPEFFGYWTPAIGDFDKPLNIANDRTEIYAIGTSDETSAWRAALEPDAVAISNAENRVAAAARILGVRNGYDSLIVRYLSDLSYVNSRGVRAIGLAVTGENDTHASWRRAVINRSLGASRGVAPFRLAPIAPYAEDRSIRGEAEIPVVAPADGTRLAITITARTEDAVALDPFKLVATLRTLPHVRDVAVKRASSVGSQVQLEFVFDTTARSDVNRVRDRVAATYRVAQVDFATRMAGITHDCANLDSRGMRLALNLATNDALLQADAASVKLRKLLVAEVYPMIAPQRECETRAAIVDWPSTGTPPDPLYVHATMHAALTFRTSAPVH